jgi:hypothetical protein
MLTEKDKELMATRSQIHSQLAKIVHRTWYIFDPDRKAKARDTFRQGQTKAAIKDNQQQLANTATL